MLVFLIKTVALGADDCHCMTWVSLTPFSPSAHSSSPNDYFGISHLLMPSQLSKELDFLQLESIESESCTHF